MNGHRRDAAANMKCVRTPLLFFIIANRTDFVYETLSVN